MAEFNAKTKKAKKPKKLILRSALRDDEGDITKGIEDLLLDTKPPPTASSPPIESVGDEAVANLIKANEENARLIKANEELERENEEMKKEIMKLKHDAIVLRKSMAPWLPKLEDLPEKAREKWGNEEITTATLSSTSVRGRTYRFVLANGKHTVDKEYILRTETGDSGHYFLRKNHIDEWHFISRKVRDKQAPLEDKAALDALRASNEDDGT